jgi:hypothetical protein
VYDDANVMSLTDLSGLGFAFDGSRVNLVHCEPKSSVTLTGSNVHHVGGLVSLDEGLPDLRRPSIWVATFDIATKVTTFD